MARVLVTGVNGFVGTHLADALVQDGHQVIGVGLSDREDDAPHPNLVSHITCDITNPNEVSQLQLDQIDAVINLAGLAAVGKSFDIPDEYMRVNTAVISVICDEIVKRGLQSQIRMLAISSGAIYANNQPMPLTEESLTDKESSPYAASKITMERLAADYSQVGLECIVARPFNHIGPGQTEGFLLPDLYDRLKESLELKQPILVGNLTTLRDYTDVRDVVRAYVALIAAPILNYPIYNVCSGKPRSGEEVLQTLIEVMGQPTHVVVDSKRFRPSDAPVLYGDHRKITTDTKWAPEIDFKQTVADYVASRAT